MPRYPIITVDNPLAARRRRRTRASTRLAPIPGLESSEPLAKKLNLDKSAVDPKGTCTPPDRQPCRLLPRVRLRSAPRLVAHTALTVESCDQACRCRVALRTTSAPAKPPSHRFPGASALPWPRRGRFGEPRAQSQHNPHLALKPPGRCDSVGHPILLNDPEYPGYLRKWRWISYPYPSQPIARRMRSSNLSCRCTYKSSARRNPSRSRSDDPSIWSRLSPNFSA